MWHKNQPTNHSYFQLLTFLILHLSPIGQIAESLPANTSGKLFSLPLCHSIPCSSGCSLHMGPGRSLMIELGHHKLKEVTQKIGACALQKEPGLDLPKPHEPRTPHQELPVRLEMGVAPASKRKQQKTKVTLAFLLCLYVYLYVHIHTQTHIHSHSDTHSHTSDSCSASKATAINPAAFRGSGLGLKLAPGSYGNPMLSSATFRNVIRFPGGGGKHKCQGV